MTTRDRSSSSSSSESFSSPDGAAAALKEQDETRDFALAERLSDAADRTRNNELANLLRDAALNVRWADPPHSSLNNAYGTAALPEAPVKNVASLLEIAANTHLSYVERFDLIVNHLRDQAALPEARRQEPPDDHREGNRKSAASRVAALDGLPPTVAEARQQEEEEVSRGPGERLSEATGSTANTSTGDK